MPKMSQEWIGIVISWVGLGIAFWQLRDVRRSRKRTESPFFEFTRLLIHTPQWKNAKGKEVVVFAEPLDGSEVPDDYAEGDPVMLCAYNKGGEARMTKVAALTDLPIQLGWHDRISGDNDLQIRYRFSKARKGKPERIRITYETVSGEKGEQIFEFVHGHSGAERKRIK
ncbi:MAG: hypothetical protein HY674_20140 [Chloroflexi bacterium]|nr:hypothetical protein [Chloroflexota bacterium]